MSTSEYLSSLFSLEGKVIILTGATGGIGEALAMGLGRAGATAVLTGTRKEKLEEVCAAIRAEGGKADGRVMNMRNKEEIQPFVDGVIRDYGQIDVLVNCAGVNLRLGLLDFPEEEYDRIMDINFKNVYFLTQAVGREMIKRHTGNVINIASYNTTGMLGGCSVYGASKSAIYALTRSVAVEWAQYGIRSNAIAPGHILTPMTAVNWQTARADYLRPRIAMERPGKPEELVGCLIWLASDASSYTTGQLFNVDGGYLAGGSPWHYDTEYDSKY